MMRVEVDRRHRRARGRVAPVGGAEAAYDLVPARPARRRTPRRPGRPAASGPSRRCGSRAASRGSASTPTTARSPTRRAGSAARRPPRQGLLPRPGDGRAGAHPGPAAAPADAAAPRRLREPAARAAAPTCCTTATRSSASSAAQRPPPRARPDRAGAGQAQRAARRDARRRRPGRRAGGRRRPRGRPARAPDCAERGVIPNEVRSSTGGPHVPTSDPRGARPGDIRFLARDGDAGSRCRGPGHHGGWRDLYFSPNGDARRDIVRVPFRVERNGTSVSVLVRRDATVVAGPIQLGPLPRGKHVWRWDGRNASGGGVTDGRFAVVFRARRAGAGDQARASLVVDRTADDGRLVATRATIHPEATVVHDSLRVAYLRQGWWRWEATYPDEVGPLDGRPPLRLRMDVVADDGERVWRQRWQGEGFTPEFDFDARRGDGSAFPAGSYTASGGWSTRPGTWGRPGRCRSRCPPPSWSSRCGPRR